MDSSEWNAAARRGWELVELLNDVDVAGMVEGPEFSEWFTPDFVREDRRRLIGAPTVDTAGFVDQMQAWFEIGEGTPTFRPLEVVAVAGERLAAVRFSVAFASGYEVEMIHVALFDEEVLRQQRIVSFDVEERELAVRELGRLAAEVGS